MLRRKATMVSAIFRPQAATSTTGTPVPGTSKYPWRWNTGPNNWPPAMTASGQAKTDHYTEPTIERTREACAEALQGVIAAKGETPAAPPIHNIERWWSPSALTFLCHLQDAIAVVTKATSQEATLLKVTFCRTLIACSNAAFNHQSMSFKEAPQAELDIAADYPGLFKGDLAFVLQGARESPEGEARIVLHDARALSTLDAEPFDLVVTSPPYANRMSYIRELRPYMYWLRFLMSGRDAGELDWLAIGGTWGVATSRLTEWEAGAGAYTSPDLEQTLAGIGNSKALFPVRGPAGKALDMLDSALGGGSGQLSVDDPSEIRLSLGLGGPSP